MRVLGTGHVVVGEGPQHEHDGVGLTDVGEELVAQTLALDAPSTSPPMSTTWTEACTMFLLLDSSANRSSRSSGTLATPMFGSLVANAYGRSERAAAGERVEQRGLSRVGQPNQTETFHVAGEAIRRAGVRDQRCGSVRVLQEEEVAAVDPDDLASQGLGLGLEDRRGKGGSLPADHRGPPHQPGELTPERGRAPLGAHHREDFGLDPGRAGQLDGAVGAVDYAMAEVGFERLGRQSGQRRGCGVAGPHGLPVGPVSAASQGQLDDRRWLVRRRF